MSVNTFGTRLSSDTAKDIWQQKVDPFNFGTDRPQ